MLKCGFRRENVFYDIIISIDIDVPMFEDKGGEILSSKNEAGVVEHLLLAY